MEFNLTPKEFLFLCFVTGAPKIYGVEDAFKHTTDMSSEIRNIQRSLEDKNYIESDFDGNSEINPTLLELADICADFNSAVMFTHLTKEQVFGVNYYRDKASFVKLTKTADVYTLTRISANDFKSDLMSYITFKSVDDLPGNHEFVFKRNQFEQIKSDLLCGKKDEALPLLKSKMTDDMAEIISSALEGNEDFYSLALVSKGGASDFSDTVMTIDTQKGALLVKPQIVDLENAVKIINCSRKNINNFIDVLVAKAIG